MKVEWTACAVVSGLFACSAPAPRAAETMPASERGLPAPLVETTLERPLESCGLGDALEKLAVMTCPDGAAVAGYRNVFGAARSLRLIRTVEPGGQHGNPIEHYSGDCRGHAFSVFIDRGVCPIGGNPRT